MKPKRRIASLALAALTLAGQLTLPAAASAPALTGDLSITETFSDRRLQAWLLNAANLGGAGADGLLTEAERAEVTALDLSDLGLTSLDGLAAFPNLKTLNCANNQLTALDLSGNPGLERLSCGSNRLTALDLSHNRQLQYLNCNFNQIKRLDLTGHGALRALYCEMNGMEQLDLTGCAGLLTLYCRNNQLTKLELGDCGGLEFIETFDNRLTDIDVSHLVNLRFLHIDHNQLTTLDLRQNRKLEGGGFVARNNRMERIQLPQQPGLTVYLDDYGEQDPIDGSDRVAWYLDEECTREAPAELAAEGQTLYSRRIPNRYTIYFASNGGGGSMPAQIAQWGSRFPLRENAFTRMGYAFAGWSAQWGSQSVDYEDRAEVENLAGQKTDGDRTTLYAQWTANDYTIRLEPNGAAGSAQERTVQYGTEVTLDNPFTHSDSDQVFAGWALKEDGPARYPDRAAVRNLTAEKNGVVTLYALWRTSLAGEQKPYLSRLEEKFQSMTAEYTQEDRETLSAAYGDGVRAVQAAGDTAEMERAAAAAEAAMEAVPTAAARLEEITGGWQRAHRQALQLLAEKNLTEDTAAGAASAARSALEDLEQTALERYSGLGSGEERTQMVGQAARSLQDTADQLMTLTQAAAWLQSLDGLTLRPMHQVRAEDLDAYQAALTHCGALEGGQKAYLSAGVEDSLTQRYQLAGQKRSDAADLQSAYEGLDQNAYSAKGQAALAAALERGLASISAAASPETSQTARKEAWTRMSQVPTADQESAAPPVQPAPPAGGGSAGGGGSIGGGGSVGGGGAALPEQPAAGETVTVTDERTGASAQVSTAADGTVTAQVTVPQGAGQATLAIPCRGGSATVAVIVGEDGVRRVLPYAVYGGGALTVRLSASARIEVVENAKTFSDVGEGAWYEEAVQFTASRELFSGVGGGAFAPGGTMTRAMVVTVLHRLEGSPAPSGGSAFQDVPRDAWYSAAADWAAEQGVSAGAGGAAFSPGSPVTREQLAVMLYRYAGSPALEQEDLSAFQDGAQVAPWAREAVAWACARGILAGDGSGRLRPGDDSTRAEVSAMVSRFVRQSMA